LTEKVLVSKLLTCRNIPHKKMIDWLVLNANFSSISAISWRSKKRKTTDVQQVTDKPYTLKLCQVVTGSHTW